MSLDQHPAPTDATDVIDVPDDAADSADAVDRPEQGNEEIEEQDLEFATSVSLFEGDEGGLEFRQRLALVTLLKQRFISARTHPRDWRVLVEHERVLRSRLNDLFLDLQIDREREVAWKRQASGEAGARFPTLLHDTAWSREETLVLVHLRDRLRAGLATGDTRVFVDRDDILDHVASFRPSHATDEAGDEKRARNAVVSLVKAGLLIGAATDDRFEISEAVEPLLPLELLTELLEALRRANGSPGQADEGVAPDLFDDGADAVEPEDREGAS
ncbi:DUF4194 domain-containing protein [Nocardioides sp.]|uniref:DUF4194 domain-containing protein n=1 Tax=Nocardioides sp. TaxID=35761 RepID=UPI0035130DB5